MAAFIAIVRDDIDNGYTASFPDFPGCTVSECTLDRLIAKARETLLVHIQCLLDANQGISCPSTVDAIDRGDALLLAAVDVPDDLGIAHIDVAIPALSLARIDSLALRHGLTRGALFVEAVNRWSMQEFVHRERRSGANAPTLFDFSNPLELKVEAIAVNFERPDEARSGDGGVGAEVEIRGPGDDITAELARLFDETSESQPASGAGPGARTSPELEAK